MLDVAPLLADGPLHGLRVGILHGRLPADEKDAIMRAFAAGEIDVLVATTVIEVGVDVPNATVMVVLDADRFGVSQLHQLRGRVGRGSAPGLCLLVTEALEGTPARERLDAVASTTDGFELAELDLEQRREGDVLGVNQSGRRSQPAAAVPAARRRPDRATPGSRRSSCIDERPGPRPSIPRWPPPSPTSSTTSAPNTWRRGERRAGARGPAHPTTSHARRRGVVAVTRIIAGEHGGRRLVVPAGRDTRPTSDRVREALFSTLESATDLDGARFADLYAGSGAVGLEALSRGATHVLLVEADPKAARAARENIAALGRRPRCGWSTDRVERVLGTPPDGAVRRGLRRPAVRGWPTHGSTRCSTALADEAGWRRTPWWWSSARPAGPRRTGRRAHARAPAATGRPCCGMRPTMTPAGRTVTCAKGFRPTGGVRTMLWYGRRS